MILENVGNPNSTMHFNIQQRELVSAELHKC